MGTDVPYPKSELIKREDLVTRTHDELHVVHKIQARVVERRLRLTEFFQDYDPLRKGFCNHGQVKSIFALLKISLEPDELNELFQAYAREAGLFCDAACCQEVDQAFTTNHLEKQPLARIAMAKLEEGIRARISTRRILVRPDFKQMDTAHRGHVSMGQLARVMDSLGFQMDAAAIDLLGYAYCDLGNHTDFNYNDFCLSVDPPSEDVAEA